MSRPLCARNSRFRRLDRELDDSGAQTILDDFSGLVEDADTVVMRLAFVDDDEWWLGFLFDGELFLLDGAPEGDHGGRPQRSQDHLPVEAE